MGTKRNPGTFDCHGAAGPDEPIFTLRANDPLAALTVRVWTVLYVLHKSPGIWSASAGRWRAKAKEAWQCAGWMRNWKRRHPE